MKIPFLAGLCSLVFSGQALACSVCFGDPNSLQSKALSGAVLFLLVVIGSVLAAIAYLAFSWSRRAKQMDAALGSCSAPDRTSA